MKAFVLISLQSTDETKVLEEVKQFSEVEKAYVLFGEWDILAQLNIESAEALGSFMISKIRSRSDVKLTSSMIVAKD